MINALINADFGMINALINADFGMHEVSIAFEVKKAACVIWSRRKNLGSKLFCHIVMQQNCKEVIEKKTLKRFLQHSPFQRELLILKREIICSLFSFPSHCHTLRGDLYPNTTDTYSQCKECFGAWKVLGICQNKPVRLGGAIRRYCRIW